MASDVFDLLSRRKIKVSIEFINEIYKLSLTGALAKSAKNLPDVISVYSLVTRRFRNLSQI